MRFAPALTDSRASHARMRCDLPGVPSWANAATAIQRPNTPPKNGCQDFVTKVFKQEAKRQAVGGCAEPSKSRVRASAGEWPGSRLGCYPMAVSFTAAKAATRSIDPARFIRDSVHAEFVEAQPFDWAQGERDS